MYFIKPFRTGKSHTYLLAGLIGLILASCNDPSGRENAGKDYYDRYLAEASKRYGSYYETPALQFLDSAYQHAPELSTNERFKFYGYYCGYYYQMKKDYLKAMAYADSMVWIIEKTNNERKMVHQYAQAYYSKGDVYFGAGNYDEAYKYFFKSKIIAANLDDCIASEYRYRLGMVLYRQERFRSAADNFRLAFDQAGSCKDDYDTFLRRQELLSNIGLSYSKTRLPDSALIYFNKAIHFINENEPKYQDKGVIFEVARGVVYGNLGDVYVQKGDLGKAEELFEKAIRSNSSPHTDLSDGQLTRIKLARLYKEQNRVSDLRRVLEETRAGMDSVNSAAVERDWHGLMSQYLISVDQPRKAFDHLLIFNELKDSIQQSKQDLLSGDANAQLLGLEKEYEIELLKKNSELQQIYLWAAFIFTLMVLVIVFLVYKNGQRSKKSVLELRKLNDQINQQNDTLEQALASLELRNKEKDRILHTVAHDLRNPIGGIAAISGLMLENSDTSSEQSEVFSLIQTASKDTLTLINELLEAADGRNVEMAGKQWVDVNSLLNNIADLLQYKAQEKKQRIITELDEEQQIFINREKISRVLSNLINNAIKFSPPGAEITISTTNIYGKTLISVRDEGIGIPDNLKDRIFDMFTSAKRPGTSGERPFGLGLYISSEIIKAHQGRLWFENNSVGGSTFYIELPGAEDTGKGRTKAEELDFTS